MLLYKYFCFSEVMDQIFLTARGAVQGSFRATHSSLCLCSCRLTTRMGSVEMFSPTRFFSCRLSILFKFLRWHLRPLIIDSCNVRIAWTK